MNIFPQITLKMVFAVLYVNLILKVLIGVFNQALSSNLGLIISHPVSLSPINYRLFIKIT